MVNSVAPSLRKALEAEISPPKTSAAARPVEVFYASADGTGIPIVKKELAGNAGRQSDGSAKTREVKLGCVFTQQGVDEEGRPMRDPDSSSYPPCYGSGS